MRKQIFTGCILILLIFNTYASISKTYQYTSYTNTSESTTKTQLITNDPIVLNPEIDEITASDPRIDSVIEYAKLNGTGVSVMFFNPDNLRYVKKVNEMFQANHIYTDPPQLSKTNNLLEFNLIKIYVIKDKSHVSTTKPAASSVKPNKK